MDERGSRLLFVYNADGGPLAALWDAAHKLVSPGTYPCDLCAITYGAVSMRPEWRTYVEQLPYPAEFMHRDEFQRSYPEAREPLPAIFLARGGAVLERLVGADQMRPVQNVAELIALVDRGLTDQRGQAV